jgi:2-haloacid dehalogenase
MLRPMRDLDLSTYDVLTFDCFGTIVDWDRGVLDGLRRALEPLGVEASDAELLADYARHEAALQHGGCPRYRDVVAGTLAAIARERGVEPSADTLAAFGDSVGDWPPFDDSVDALRRLGTRYRLCAVTNCDDDLFARTRKQLGEPFDWVVTAEQAGAYKPDHAMFELAFARVGVPRERILHVAQSLFHDHVPAAELGLDSVWIDRRGEGSPSARPGADPDMILADLRSLAERAGV